ncbi:pentapeptide repeat-containing protein [Nostoc sp.]|uniref:pentapeptide repeat-containing protein n=1 Tax=Nostoc sp. TaxID=1180 RepID=UPI002FF6FA31
MLVESNLNGANLRNANLINADFSNANVEKAQFGNNQGISIQTRADLIQRGASFVA